MRATIEKIRDKKYGQLWRVAVFVTNTDGTESITNACEFKSKRKIKKFARLFYTGLKFQKV